MAKNIFYFYGVGDLIMLYNDYMMNGETLQFLLQKKYDSSTKKKTVK